MGKPLIIMLELMMPITHSLAFTGVNGQRASELPVVRLGVRMCVVVVVSSCSCGRNDITQLKLWPCGLMDKASDFGSEDCRFESCQGRYNSFSYFATAGHFLTAGYPSGSIHCLI